MHPSKPEACFSARTGLTGVRFMTISDVPSIITITLLMTIGKGVWDRRSMLRRYKGQAARETVVAPVRRRLGVLLLPWRGNIL